MSKERPTAAAIIAPPAPKMSEISREPPGIDFFTRFSWSIPWLKPQAASPQAEILQQPPIAVSPQITLEPQDQGDELTIVRWSRRRRPNWIEGGKTVSSLNRWLSGLKKAYRGTRRYVKDILLLLCG